MYTLCTTLESVKLASQVFSASEYVILDCEGRELGTRAGALSLVCLGDPEGRNVFIFDILSLPPEALQLLFSEVLDTVDSDSTKRKIKVVWDGRMDYSELFFGHNYSLDHTLDLQLIDVSTRALRGESDNSRLRRICRRDFPWPKVMKLQLEGVYVLNSMDSALREHCVVSSPPKSGESLT